jgi:hypothetical protein
LHDAVALARTAAAGRHQQGIRIDALCLAHCRSDMIDRPA